MSGRGLLRRWIDGVRRAVGAAPRSRRARADHADPAEHVGGPFLHWVPDHGGHRLAGDFLPPSQRRTPPSPTRPRRRSRRV